MLAGCNLGYTNLSKATLSGATLMEADLHHTHLDRTDLSGALFGRTSVADCDLSRATGLSRVVHSEESSIGQDTLRISYRSAGYTLTDGLRNFFRGAGVPDELLSQIARILGDLKVHSYFIAYGEPTNGLRGSSERT
jgi:uncharacterized protein YjbI with pentapeptide repeats